MSVPVAWTLGPSFRLRHPIGPQDVSFALCASSSLGLYMLNAICPVQGYASSSEAGKQHSGLQGPFFTMP